MDAKLFLEALEQYENEKHISKEAVEEALKEALKKAYIKSQSAADDANVVVIVSHEPAEIKINHILDVVADDDEEDKSLQIALSDAKKYGDYQVGDQYVISVDPDSLSRLAALAVKSILRQKVSEIDKTRLFQKHQENVGTLVSGTVEKCDEKGVLVSIDGSSFTLSRKDLIGDEMFKNGAIIRMYLSKAENSDKGPTLKLSRSDVGFLKCIIDEEIPEVHKGDIVIKDIVRKAGVRAKVSVYSTNPQVEPVATCLGRGAYTLRNICNKVGTSSMKEKVNFVQYSDNILAYAADALRPANIISIGLESYTYTDRAGEEHTIEKVIAIVGNDEKEMASALGAKKANLDLAKRLINREIEVLAEKDLADSDYADLEFVSVESLRAEAKAKVATKIIVERAEEIQRTLPNQGAYIKAKPQQITDEDLVDETPVVEETPVVSPVVNKTPVEASTSPVEEAPVAETPVEEKTIVVKTTTTLESLEKSLETSKKKESFKGNTKKKPRKITDDEVEEEIKPSEPVVKKAAPQMEIYSQEEIEAMEAEDYEDEVEEDIDYEEYEDYYDDEN